VADDGDWETKLGWARTGRGQSEITITWDVPTGTPAGTYRICYFGDARDADGQVRAVSGATRPFSVE
jgi:neutral ceramidase